MVTKDHTSRHSSSARTAFQTTHWSVVLAAGAQESPTASAALENLCRAYWFPLYAHVRARGNSPQDAEDLTQGFFACLLAGRWLGMADSRRGRFRAFLLAALDHFLANEWDRACCQKRGGRLVHVPFDTVAAEQCYASGAGLGLTAEEIYERNWALQFLEQVRRRLREEYLTTGTSQRFELLESFLPGEESPLTYAEAAARLGVPEGTLKSDVHRLKRRYAELVREEVAHTVGSVEEVDDELRHLAAVLAR